MTEKNVIVNEKDEIIGAKERSEITRKDIYRVSLLWIENSKGDILLAKRGFSKTHSPGLWAAAVAGTVEEGEDYKSNILKEAKEELGLENFKIRSSKKVFLNHNYQYFCTFFFVILDQPLECFRLNKPEVEEIKWFTKKELEQQLETSPNLFVLGLKEYYQIFQSN